MIDVIVGGAGPAGSVAAKEIARKGWRVVLLERGERPGQRTVCGGGLEDADVKEMGLPDDLIHRRLVRREHHFPWGVTTTTEPHMTTLRRELDAWLAQEAVSAGAELVTGVRARTVVRHKTGSVVVTAAERKTGQQTSYQSRLVIFADGPNTLAPRVGNLGFVRTPKTAAVGLVYELAWPGTPMDHYEVHFGGDWSPWGYIWVFPKRDLLNVGITMLPSRGVSRSLEKRLKCFVNGRSDLSGRQVVRRAGAHIPVAPANRIYDDSMMAAGDAAGMVDPLTGAGIAHAAAGGRLAGQVACEALSEGDFSATSLSRYQSRWQETSRYHMIHSQARLTRIMLPLCRFDQNLCAKLVQFLFLGGELGRWQKIRMLAYPLLQPRVAHDV